MTDFSFKKLNLFTVTIRNNVNTNLKEGIDKSTTHNDMDLITKSVIAVILRYFTEFGKHMRSHT